MKLTKAKHILRMITASVLLGSGAAKAQEYAAPTKPVQTGRSPGVKVKLLSTNGAAKTYMLIFSKGDEVVSGLTEFAQKYQVTSGHYQAIGDATSAKVGWYDYDRKEFKVIPIDEPCEVSSLTGDVAVYNGKPVAHTHLVVSTSDGLSRGGHLLELFVGPTLEVFVTVEPTPLYKKLSPEFGAGLIDPALDK
jgi:uncharacterized protein